MEGPVHIEEVGRRLSRLWGYKRAGKLIQSRVADAVKTLDCSGRIRVSGAGGARFREPAAGSKIVVRDRSAVKSRTLRKVEMLPPVEVRQAILEAVKRNVGLSSADCAREVCHALGFKKTSADMRRLVEDEAERLVEEGRLMRSGEELRLAGGTA